MPSNNPNYQKEYIRQHYLDNKDYYKQKAKERKESMSFAQCLYERARTRARKEGFPFNLELSDIVIPEKCPVLNVNLVEKDFNLSPSIDKIIPSLGYVKGNIAIISQRANRIKNDASKQEIELLYRWLQSLSS